MLSRILIIAVIAVAFTGEIVESFHTSQRNQALRVIVPAQRISGFRLRCESGKTESPVTNSNASKLEKSQESVTDDADLDEEAIQRELDMLDEIDGGEVDIDMISESDADKAIEVALKNMLGPKEPELSPTEKFDMLYKDLKSANKDEKVKKFNHVDMLATIFSDSQKKDPFDDRKVMMKLRKMLETQDFEELFKDPNIGDFM